MNAIIELIKLVPRSVQIALVGILIGGLAFAGHEMRYMTVADFTKSYVLEIKEAIRSLRRDLRDEDLSDRDREAIKEDIEQLIDELCYEVQDDPYCKQVTA